MISTPEFAKALIGLNRILRQDITAWNYFSATNQGFWHSYTAAFIAAPLFLAQVLMFYYLRPEKPALAAFLIIQGIGFVINWTLWPVLMMTISRFLGKPDRFYRYMVAYNWFKLFEVGVATPLAIMVAMGVFPQALIMALGVMVQAAMLYYEWTIARNGMGVPGITAVVFVLIDMQIFLMIGYTSESILTGAF